ncbi:hypothetical protein QCA50_020143 [Cerrena zonata]|uniref:Pentatricopeptide repeat-containing protein n=1 Tax=Cerrena zonata TaxID=2478898 RepID=A0AAW0FI78_9APHY
MSAYLRLKQKDRAKKVYEKMLEYDVHPTSITFSLILKSYGNPRSEGDIERAENFLSEVLAQEDQSWMNALGGRAAALQSVYGPVMTAWLKKVKPVEVERLYNKMIEAGGRPTLGTLTLLWMSTDGRRCLTRSAKSGLRYTNLHRNNLLRRMLCSVTILHLNDVHEVVSFVFPYPFTQTPCLLMAITTLSPLHGRKVQKDGYVLDAHNWNHLCVALLRAGQVERAFALIEQIIIPTQNRSRYAEPREPPPITTPFFSDVDPRLILPSEGALHNARRRSGRVEYHSTKSKRRWEKQKPEDFAHPLHILYQLSPAWNIWRPHNTVLQLLGLVLRHLRRGGIIKPIHKPGQKGLRLSILEENDTDVMTMREQEAAEMYDRIVENYPLTYKAVTNFFSGRNILYTRYQAARKTAGDKGEQNVEDKEKVEGKGEEGTMVDSDVDASVRRTKRLRPPRRSHYGLKEKKYSRST